MSKNLTISCISIIAFIVTNVENKPPFSPEQLDLVASVANPELWPGLWFNSIPYENEWILVSYLLDRRSRQGVGKKLTSIPLIMACEYGVRFHGFLSLAIHVVGECTQYDRAGDCWTKLRDGLRRGSSTMLAISRTLDKIHSIVGDNIDEDEFHKVLLKIITLFTRHRIVESSASLQNSPTYTEALKEHTRLLRRVLTGTCYPRFTRLNIQDLIIRNEGREQNRHDICLRKMDFYIGYVDNHLANLGFSYDRNTGRVTYDYPTPVELTQNQLDLIDGFYQQNHWCHVWFKSVKDAEDWMLVDRLLIPRLRPAPLKKLHLAPKMLACMYGVNFYWFLRLALDVIAECNRLSRNDDDHHASNCWNRLGERLQEGLCTTIKVIRSLTYAHSTIGDDINSDAFYQRVTTIRDFLTDHNVMESTVVLPEGLNYVQLMENHVANLHTLLTSNCQPEYPQLNVNELVNERRRQFPGANRYDFYAHIMKYHIEDISNHLFNMGFRNDLTGHTNFIYPL